MLVKNNTNIIDSAIYLSLALFLDKCIERYSNKKR